MTATSQSQPQQPQQLQMLQQRFLTTFQEKETEGNWQQFDAALQQILLWSKDEKLIGGVVSAGPNSFLSNMAKQLKAAIVKCLLSDRSRLSGSACEVSAALAKALGPQMELDAFVPPLIRLCTRANKINVQRATQCLLQMVRSHPQSYRQIPRLAECMRTGQNKSQRYSVIQALAELLRLHTEERRSTLEDYCADLEAGLRMGLTDAESTVREVSRGAYQRYKDLFPQRSDAFESNLPPSTRKYLSVQQRPAVEQRKPIVVAAAAVRRTITSAAKDQSTAATLTSERTHQQRPATATSIATTNTSLPPKTPQRLLPMPARIGTPAASSEESQQHHHFGTFSGAGGGAARAAPPQRLPFSQMKAQRILPPASRTGDERKDTTSSSSSFNNNNAAATAAAAAMLLPKRTPQQQQQQMLFPSRSIPMTDKLDVVVAAAHSSASSAAGLDSVRSTPVMPAAAVSKTLDNNTSFPQQQQQHESSVARDSQDKEETAPPTAATIHGGVSSRKEHSSSSGLHTASAKRDTTTMDSKRDTTTDTKRDTTAALLDAKKVDWSKRMAAFESLCEHVLVPRHSISTAVLETFLHGLNDVHFRVLRVVLGGWTMIFDRDDVPLQQYYDVLTARLLTIEEDPQMRSKPEIKNQAHSLLLQLKDKIPVGQWTEMQFHIMHAPEHRQNVRVRQGSIQLLRDCITAGMSEYFSKPSIFRMALSRLAGSSDLVDKAVQKDVRSIIKAIHDGNEFAFYEAILCLGSHERKYIQDLMKRELPQFAVHVDQHSRRALKDKKPEVAAVASATSAAKKFKSQIARPVSRQTPMKEERPEEEIVTAANECMSLEEELVVKEAAAPEEESVPTVTEEVVMEIIHESMLLKEEPIADVSVEMTAQPVAAKMPILPIATVKAASETATTNTTTSIIPTSNCLKETTSMNMRQVAEQILDCIIAEAVSRNPRASDVFSGTVQEVHALSEANESGDPLSGIASGDAEGVSALVEEALGFDQERLLEALHQGFPKMKNPCLSSIGRILDTVLECYPERNAPLYIMETIVAIAKLRPELKYLLESFVAAVDPLVALPHVAALVTVNRGSAGDLYLHLLVLRCLLRDMQSSGTSVLGLVPLSLSLLTSLFQGLEHSDANVNMMSRDSIVLSAKVLKNEKPFMDHLRSELAKLDAPKTKTLKIMLDNRLSILLNEE